MIWGEKRKERREKYEKTRNDYCLGLLERLGRL